MKKESITFLTLISIVFLCFVYVSTLHTEEKDTSLDSTLIDISRLSITHVSASSVNGKRSLNNKYYGVLNLFDNGDNVINGVNYAYWLTNSASRHWVKLTFDKPVLIDSATIETTGKRQPKEFALEFSQISGKSKSIIKYFDSIPIKGFRTTYKLPQPIANVSEMVIIFPGPDIIEVSEIRIIGKTTNDVNLAPQRPSIGLSKVYERTLKRTRIRIKNTSSFDYELLLVGKEFFGKLKSGTVTEYRIFESAYKYNYVRLAINDEVFKLTPIDYVGETPLGNGYFTYLIKVRDLTQKTLSIETIKDE